MTMHPENHSSASGSELAGEFSALAAGRGAGSSSRRSAGENRVARNTRAIAEIAARMSRMMNFEALEPQDLYTIGQLADHLKVSLRTLRFYEQSGLLRPVREGNRRLYTHRDLEQLRVIVSLRDLEGSLGAIKAVMSKLKDMDDTRSMLAAIEGLLVAISANNRERIEELKSLNKRIDETLDKLHRAD
jgi:DNA-binding transcriptional MerR regulator